MAEVTGAGLNEIYNRVSGVSGHHPFDADTVSADWSIEAGDIVKVKRGNETYTSPLHSTSLTWRGAPEMTLSSTGSKERDAIAKVSKRKYARGGGYMNDQRFYKTFYDAYEGLYSYIEMTSSRLYTTFEGMYDGLSSEFEITRSRMYADFVGLYDGLSSEFELTRSRMYVDFRGMYDGLSSEFEITRSRMYVDFRGMYDGLGSEFELTRSRMYADFYGMYDGLSSEFELTRSRMYADFKGLYDGLGSEFELTRSRMYVDFYGMYDGLSSSFEVTRSRMYADFSGLYDGLSSEFELTMSRMYVDFDGMYDGLHSEIEVTRSRIYVDMYGLYDGLGSEFEITRSRMYADFKGLYDGLESEFELTMSRMYVDFDGMYDGLHSEIEVTRSRIYVDMYGLYDGLSSEFEVTRSRMYVDFKGMYDGLSSEFEVTRSRMYVDFNGLYDGLNSSFEVTRSRMYADFNGLYDGLSSQFEVTRSRMYVDFNGLYDGLSSEFEVTRSRMYVDFKGMYDGLGSEFEVTRSRMYVQFSGLYDGLSSTFETTRSRMYVDFNGMYDGLGSEFELTRSRMYVDFHGLYDGLGSEFEVTRSRMYVQFSGLYDGLNSSFETTRSRMYVDFKGLYDGLGSEFEVTRSRMYTQFTDLYSGLSSEFEITASGLRSTVSDVYSGLSSKLVQQANRIGMVVDGNGNIKAAQIVASINEDGTSQSIISADKVYIDGATKINEVFTISDRALSVSVPVRASSGVTTTSLQMRGSNDDYTINPSQFAGLIKDASVDGNTLTLTRINGTTITFSKAASGDKVSGSWSGKTLTVVPSQTGSDSYVSVINTGLVEDTNTTPHTFHITAYHTDNGAQSQTEIQSARTQYTLGTLAATPKIVRILNASGSTYINGTATYTIPLQTKTISSNGSDITPEDGYVGFSSVTVSVNPVVGSTFVKDGSTYYVSATKDGTEVTTARKQIALKVVDSNVVIYDGQSTVRDNTPSLALSLDTGTLTSGSRTVKIKADGAATSVTATISDYGDGWSGCYSDIGLNYSTNQTINPGSSITIYPAAKPTPSGSHASITSKGITVSATAVSDYYPSETWGTGNESNKLFINRGTTAVTLPITHTITAGATLTYNSTTHKYSATGKAFVDGSQKDVDSDNTNEFQGYTDGWTAAYGNVSIPSASSYGSYTSVSTPPSTVDGDAVTTQFDLSVDNSYAYIKKHSNAQVLARVDNTGYANGWGGCYADIGLNYSSNQTINPGSSITVYPAAKPTPSGTHASITSKGITVSASSPAYSITASSVTVADVGTVSGFTKYGSGETTYYLNTSGGVRVYTTPSMMVDGHSLTGDNTILVQVPTAVYAKGYTNGWTAAYGKVTIPSSSSYGESTSVSTPPSTVNGDPVTTQFDLSVDNSYAYIKKHSNAQVLARVDNTGYANGWGGCYADIGLNYSSNQTINPGSSITVYPAAKPTPTGTHASITSKGITVSASSPAYSITATSVTVADVGTVSGFTKYGSGESTYYLNTSGGVRVYTTPSMMVDGHSLTGDNTILVSVPTNIYVTGYNAGETNCWSNTTIDWGQATWDKSGSGGSTSIHMYIPANIIGPNSKSKAANSNWYSKPKEIWADGWQSAWGEIIFDYYPNNDYFQIYYPSASAGVPASTPAKYTISASNGTAKVTYDGTGETVCKTTYSTSSYPQTKTMTCVGKTYTSSQWKYTFEYYNSSEIFNTNTNYKFHNNSSYT